MLRDSLLQMIDEVLCINVALIRKIIFPDLQVFEVSEYVLSAVTMIYLFQQLRGGILKDTQRIAIAKSPSSINVSVFT